MSFPDFWQLYPRKIARKAAQSVWEKSKLDEISDKVIAGLKRQLPTMTEARFIPHPRTWLSQGRWEDELHVEVRPGAQGRPPPVPISESWKQSCAWRSMMNVWLLAIVRTRGGVEVELLRRLVAERNRLADQCREMWGPAIPESRDMDILGGMLARLESLR